MSKKNKVISIRVNDIEYMKIKNGATMYGMNVTQYLIYLAHLKYLEGIEKHLLDKQH